MILDARRFTGECKEPEKYDEQINAWYEMALNDEKEEVRHHRLPMPEKSYRKLIVYWLAS